MGEKAKEIISVDINSLVEQLNKALADEWLAYYQYWIGAQIARGPMRQEIVAELVEHADDELKHAEMLVARIIQLGGTPVLDPADWSKLTNCGYAKPTDPHVKALLKQNIDGERCAIDVYAKLLELTKDKDAITYHMALSILEEEIEHEDDLEALLEDLAG